MALVWMYPVKDDYRARSSNGYYAVREAKRAMTFEAFHIEAVWARPALLGEVGSMADAQELCERHYSRSP